MTLASGLHMPDPERIIGVTPTAAAMVVTKATERVIREALRGISRVVVAELNHGQYRREIERLAGTVEVVGLNRVDGELIAPEAFSEAVR